MISKFDVNITSTPWLRRHTHKWKVKDTDERKYENKQKKNKKINLRGEEIRNMKCKLKRRSWEMRKRMRQTEINKRE